MLRYGVIDDSADAIAIGDQQPAQLDGDGPTRAGGRMNQQHVPFGHLLLVQRAPMRLRRRDEGNRGREVQPRRTPKSGTVDLITVVGQRVVRTD
jgi:hypothetical protein